ncbi:hypothetical protein Pst134EB_006485 [Puccinia striiformis f. sp. tritici]|nr:hypothetical protein Pst134EB_006485 [Puccinia striiformis f. sp. tritici]
MAVMPLSCTTTNHSRPSIRLRKGLSPINATGAQSRSASTSPPTQTSKPTVMGHSTETDYTRLALDVQKQSHKAPTFLRVLNRRMQPKSRKLARVEH